MKREQRRLHPRMLRAAQRRDRRRITLGLDPLGTHEILAMQLQRAANSGTEVTIEIGTSRYLVRPIAVAEYEP